MTLHELKTLIGESVGAASVCWENGDVPTGVFDIEQATAIVDRLVAAVEDLIEVERTDSYSDGYSDGESHAYYAGYEDGREAASVVIE